MPFLTRHSGMKTINITSRSCVSIQVGALVHIYNDGSVLVNHGGTEMGQGLHTKMIQVASRSLRIPVDKIHISETSTNTVPNTSPTAASASSDLNGMAVKVPIYIYMSLHLCNIL